MQEFKVNLVKMAKWLKHVGINDPKSAVVTQRLSISVSPDGKWLNMKSGEWVLANLMSLSNINPAYIVDILYWYQNKQDYIQEIFRVGGRKFFVTDDGSYSGTQIGGMLSIIDFALNEDQRKEIKIYLAIPYMSAKAKEWIDSHSFDLEIIYYPELEEIPVDPTSSTCLFAFQHKIPDTVSVPEWLNKRLKEAAYELHGTNLPPYKNFPLSP